MAETKYDQMTLTERAELHILSARQMLGTAAQHYQQAGNQLPGPQAQAMHVASAAAMFSGAQAEAALAQACAMLAANQGGPQAAERIGLGNRLVTE